MKIITFVTSYPVLDEPVVKNRLLPFINHAIKCGYQVNLITPDDRKLDVYDNSLFSHHLVKNPKISKSAGFFKRALYELTLSYRLVYKANSLKSYGVFVTVPSMFLVLSGFFIKSESAYLDLRDITWEYLSDSSLFHRLFKRAFRSFLKKSFSKFKVINVTNDTELKYVGEYVDNLETLVKVPNGISRDQFELIQNSNVPESNFTPSNEIIVSYVGNVGLAQNLKCLMDAASGLPDIKFRIIGGGNALDSIQSYAKTKGLSNVTLFGRVGWEEIPAFYQESDILYAQLSPDFAGAMPSKLYEYLATGKPVIYGGLGQAVQILKDFENVYVIEPDCPSSIISAINAAKQDGVIGDRSMVNSQRVEKEFLREDNVKKFFKHLQ